MWCLQWANLPPDGTLATILCSYCLFNRYIIQSQTILPHVMQSWFSTNMSLYSYVHIDAILLKLCFSMSLVITTTMNTEPVTVVCADALAASTTAVIVSTSLGLSVVPE